MCVCPQTTVLGPPVQAGVDEDDLLVVPRGPVAAQDVTESGH
jgi:hypothetical protein